MKNLLHRILLPYNRLRVEKISKKILPFINSGDRVLDLGAGNGLVAEYIKNHKDIKMTLLEIHNGHNQTGLKMQYYDGIKVPFRNNSFDVVLLIYVLHHSENPDLTLLEASRTANKRIIIFEEITNSSIRYFTTSFWDVLVNLPWKVRIVDLLPRFRSEKRWKESFKKFNLVLEKKILFQKFPNKRVIYVLKKE